MLTLAANADVTANNVAPTIVAHLMALANRLLPDAAGPGGDARKKGREVDTVSPSFATALSDRAAVANNER